MSADLHIHVADDSVIDDVKESFKVEFWSSRFNGHGYTRYLVGDKWYSLENVPDLDFSKIRSRRDVKVVYDEQAVDNTPDVWIGEVSWLKAALLDDTDTFIPQTVQAVSDLIGKSLPVIDDDFIEKIRDAFTLDNNTVKDGGVWDGNGYALADVEDVCSFLEQHKGKRAFTISW